jgi:hypothetical protein
MPDPKSEAWYQERLDLLTPERLRHLLRLGAAWDFFCAQMQDHHAAYAEDPWVAARSGETSAAQIFIHRELISLVSCVTRWGRLTT